MLTREYELLIHRYLDGELDASSILRVEEHLRNSPSSRAYLEQLKSLDQRLSGALDRLPTPTEALEERIIANLQVHAARDPAGTPIRVLERYRRTTRNPRIAAAVILVAIGVQIAFLAFGVSTSPSDQETIDRLQQDIARLKGENEQLRNKNSADLFPGTPPLPIFPGQDSEAATARKDGPEAADPEKKPAELGPDKNLVFGSINEILDEFRRTGKWDFELQSRIMREMGQLEDLTEKDFQNLRHLFDQQEVDTMGQVFLAQVISGFFTHEKKAREFIYAQAEQDLARMKSGGESYMGDRALRRAWTNGLIHAYDSGNLNLLYEMGRYESDWVNRRNIYGGLHRIGSSDAAQKLAHLAFNEKNEVLKYEALNDLYDLVFADPSIRQSVDQTLYKMMEAIILGDFGKNGGNYDSMIWALYILQDLGYPIDGLQRQWQEKNKTDKGGDRRGGHPRGIPFPR